MTSPCHLQPPISLLKQCCCSHRVPAWMPRSASWGPHITSPALILYLGQARPPKGATWAERSRETEATHTLSPTKLRDCEVD